ncbi:amidohydrolase family protein [Tepidanaerobacter sp. EBM-49]|uniref:amidohydrolase family protein n=1 Tax=Tepidanaerobacter sp. EBM-49 TaxID=1918504 RepID=UPI002580A921|nr:amidohydrolase family protein [Tepidanaerobacter sp. EBM-49]
MKKIIDFHAHLGDILQNKNVTFKQNIRHGSYPDPFEDLEKSGFKKPESQSEEEHILSIFAGQYRVQEGTLQNLSIEMDNNNIAYSCVHPILPNTSFEEYLAASKLEPRLITFTSADYSLGIEEMCNKLKKDIVNGAKGLKIHQILQNVSLNEAKVREAVKVFGEKNLPILVHCGVFTFYTPDQPYEDTPEYGDIKYIIELVREFPDYTIVVAHGAEGDVELLAREAKKPENVFVDTSYCTSEYIQKSVHVLGENNVLFGTDFPFIRPKYGIKVCEEALANDPAVLDKVFFKNAACILHLEDNF